MNAQELRELDEWIAMRIFGKYPLIAEVKWRNEDGTPKGWGQWGDIGGTNGSWPLPHYTTDKAAAMEVLERCIIEVNRHDLPDVIVVDRNPAKAWFVYLYGAVKRESKTISREDTFELAICLFAKQLFSK